MINFDDIFPLPAKRLKKKALALHNENKSLLLSHSNKSET
jgi:hypothetical protein